VGSAAAGVVSAGRLGSGTTRRAARSTEPAAGRARVAATSGAPPRREESAPDGHPAADPLRSGVASGAARAARRPARGFRVLLDAPDGGRHARPRPAAPGEVPDGASGMLLAPGLVPGIPAYSIEVHAKFPDHAPAIRGVLVLHDLATGAPLAVMESGHLAALRTGLAGASGAGALARPGAAAVAIVGAGATATRGAAAGAVRLRGPRVRSGRVRRLALHRGPCLRGAGGDGRGIVRGCARRGRHRGGGDLGARALPVPPPPPTRDARHHPRRRPTRQVGGRGQGAGGRDGRGGRPRPRGGDGRGGRRRPRAGGDPRGAGRGARRREAGAEERAGRHGVRRRGAGLPGPRRRLAGLRPRAGTRAWAATSTSAPDGAWGRRRAPQASIAEDPACGARASASPGAPVGAGTSRAASIIARLSRS
jgi:Ornithine cyclodeaminase/mu-crystallin family